MRFGFPSRCSVWLTFKNYDGGGDAAFQVQVEIQVEMQERRANLTCWRSA